MSIICENELGYFISHKDFIDAQYKEVGGSCYCLSEKLFKILHPYKRKKYKPSNKKHEDKIELMFYKFMETLRKQYEFLEPSLEKNDVALKAAETVYNHSGKAMVSDSFGCNGGSASLQEINNHWFLFPKYCEFFCKEVSEISVHLSNRQYDFILLDPPWWNKYIRRKRKKSDDGYKMMYNSDLKDISIESMLKPNGLLAVWCTNSVQNLEELQNQIFPKWGVQLIATWYWVKITQTGIPICDFSDPPGKQPYEKIIFGAKQTTLKLPIDGKLVVSVPSAVHSHKPPLIELLQPYLPQDPCCLEIFARYLLPNFTSYGNEVLRLQHESLFVQQEK